MIFEAKDFLGFEVSPQCSADRANAKLADIKRAWLKELKANALRVSGHRKNDDWQMTEDICGQPKPGDTHRALIPRVFIEEIRPCAHEKLLIPKGGSISDIQCAKCFKPLRPTGWEVVEK